MNPVMNNRSRLIPLVVLLAMPAFSADAGELQVKPRITVGEEFTDNVFNSHDDREHDFITRIMPGFALQYRSKLLQWDSDYNLDYRYYARGTYGGDTSHNASVKSNLTVVENRFFVDLTDTYSRVSLDPRRDRTEEGLIRGQSDRNILNVSPYFVFVTGGRGKLKTGYRYINTWYTDEDAVSKQEHVGYADWWYELSGKAGIGLMYEFTDRKPDFNEEELGRNDGGASDSPRLHWHQVAARWMYEYAEKSVVSAEIGNRWTSYQGSVITEDGLRIHPKNTSDVFWSIGVTHTINNVVLKADTAQIFQEDPLSRSQVKEFRVGGSADAKFQKGSVGVGSSYSKYDGTSESLQQGEKYSASVRAAYDIAAPVNLSVSLTGENFFGSGDQDYPRRIIADAGIKWQWTENVVLSLLYRHVNVSTTEVITKDFNEVVEDGYRANRVFVEARASF